MCTPVLGQRESAFSLKRHICRIQPFLQGSIELSRDMRSRRRTHSIVTTTAPDDGMYETQLPPVHTSAGKAMWMAQA